MSNPNQFDHWLADSGPAALVIREYLQPVDGPDGVIFPVTFAAGDGFPGGYNIDTFPDGSNVCIIDTVGSQANRIEPIFAKDPYRQLVPQIVISAGIKQVNLLEAGHRAADAIVRCSQLQQDLQNAFKALLDGDAQPLAKIAPTSLVFGVWDSRDTQAKLPRLVSSTIRAFNVRKLTRSAQYIPAVDYVAGGLLPEPAEKKTKDTYSERGFIHVPACGTHGGVIATGGIRRDAILSLNALRLLAAGSDPQKTRSLQRYVLGLALVAFTYSPIGYLRQGCNLVLDPDKPRFCDEVYHDGRRQPLSVTPQQVLDYAQQTAQAFGVGSSKTVPFDTERAKQDVATDKDTADKKTRKSGK